MNTFLLLLLANGVFASINIWPQPRQVTEVNILTVSDALNSGSSFSKDLLQSDVAADDVFKCTVCDHVYDADADGNGVAFEDLPDDWKCPVCGNPKSAYKKQTDGSWIETHDVAVAADDVFKCTVCDHVYDADADGNGVAFEDLPDDWKCPVCGNPKSAYKKQTDGSWIEMHDVDEAHTVKLHKNFRFNLLSVLTPPPRLSNILSRYSSFLEKTISSFPSPSPSISISALDISIGDPTNLKLDSTTDYSYTLTLTSTTSSISSETIYGVQYALESFTQLFQSSSPLTLKTFTSSLVISDSPAFSWRGLMLDAGRRFSPVSLVENLLDSMAASKMNVLHFHLSDYCRWAVESLLYPRLQDNLQVSEPPTSTTNYTPLHKTNIFRRLPSPTRASIPRRRSGAWSPTLETVAFASFQSSNSRGTALPWRLCRRTACSSATRRKRTR